VNNTQNAFMMLIRVAVRAPVMLVSATFMAFTINNSLVTVFLVAIPFLATVLITVSLLAYPRFRAMLKQYDSLNSTTQENLISMRVVKSFVREDFEKEKFGKINDGLMKASMKAEKLLVLIAPTMQITMYSCIVAILWFGGIKVVAGEMETGQIISFISYVTQILMSLMMISMILINMVLSRASISRIVEILDEKIDVTDDNANKELKVENGSVEFKNVCFKYNKEGKENV
jgi:ABC-type multidrug transport system, ATPase and permease components